MNLASSVFSADTTESTTSLVLLGFPEEACSEPRSHPKGRQSHISGRTCQPSGAEVGKCKAPNRFQYPGFTMLVNDRRIGKDCLHDALLELGVEKDV